MLQWDCEGALLAVASVDQCHALLFAMATRKAARLETGLKVIHVLTLKDCSLFQHSRLHYL